MTHLWFVRPLSLSHSNHCIEFAVLLSYQYDLCLNFYPYVLCFCLVFLVFPLLLMLHGFGMI